MMTEMEMAASSNVSELMISAEKKYLARVSLSHLHLLHNRHVSLSQLVYKKLQLK